MINDSFPSTFVGVTYTATQTGGASGFAASGNINNNVYDAIGQQNHLQSNRHDQCICRRFNFQYRNCNSAERSDRSNSK